MTQPTSDIYIQFNLTTIMQHLFFLKCRLIIFFRRVFHFSRRLFFFLQQEANTRQEKQKKEAITTKYVMASFPYRVLYKD